MHFLKLMDIPSSIKSLWWTIPFLSVLFLFISFFLGLIQVMPTNLMEKGQFGDSFGVLNSLFTGLGFAGVVITLILQQRQIKQQSLEFKAQLNDALIRKYEENLFQLFLLYQDALKSVLGTRDGKTTVGRDALKASTDALLNCIRTEKVNTIPHSIQTRYQKGTLTTEDHSILDFLYFRNFWHINYSFQRQGRLIETLKALLWHLERKAPDGADIDASRKLILAQITSVEVTYFFYIALGFRDENVLRELMLSCGLMKKVSHIYKLQVHRYMYHQFWHHDLHRDKQERTLPINRKRIKAVADNEKQIRTLLEKLKSSKLVEEKINQSNE